jgi:hypothetical protein
MAMVAIPWQNAAHVNPLAQGLQPIYRMDEQSSQAPEKAAR